MWSNWLLHLRHGDDPEYDRIIRARLERYADNVLDGAQLAAGMTLADIGAGEGLIGFRAIDRIGPSLRVLFVDVSEPLLRHAEVARDRARCSRAMRLPPWCRRQADSHRERVRRRHHHPRGSRLCRRQARRAARIPPRAQARRPRFDRRTRPSRRSACRQRLAGDPREAARRTRRPCPVAAASLEGGPVSRHLGKDTGEPDHQLFRTRPGLGCSGRAASPRYTWSSTSTCSPFVHTSWETFIRTAPHPLGPAARRDPGRTLHAEERKILEEDVRRTVAAPKSVAVERVAYLTATKPPS